MEAKQILRRSNLRGLVKCKSCNFYNGIRATACKNQKCLLSKVEVKPKTKPKIHAIQLHSDGESQLFSVQVRDRDIDNRNFVSITDKIVSSDASASIINRNAICYVDTCKYDSNDVNISCKHVKSSLESCTAKATIQPINEEILLRMHVDERKREKLLNFHKQSQQSITPLVQRINQKVFVVRCDASLSFPIGMLHVICNVQKNGVRFSCACKKVDNLMTCHKVDLMTMDICEHILMVLAAILSDLNLHKEFEHLLSDIHPLLNDIDGDYQQWNSNGIASLPVTDAYDNLGGNSIAATLVDNLNNIELIQIPTILTDAAADDDGGGDESAETIDASIFNLSQCHNEADLQQVKMENLPIAVETDQSTVDELSCARTDQYPDGMELIHYRVELMDQFEMQTNESNAAAQGSHGCSGVDDTLATSNGTLGIEGIYEIDSDPSRNTDIVLSYLYPDDLSIDDLPMEIMDTFERPVSSSNSDVNLLLAANYNGIEHHSCGGGGGGGNDGDADKDDGCSEHERICRDLDASQLDAYNNWLSSVIEATNSVLDFNGNGHPEPLVFSVPHFYFDIFRTKFSAGTKKKRLPNQITVITDGKYKNLTMFTWIFSNIKLIKYILSTKIIELEVVRSFHRTMHNGYEYISASDMNKLDECYANGNNRKIRPTTYKTFLKVKCMDKFQNNKQASRQGLFVIEWIPNTLPISKYGEMIIKLKFGHMKNDKICYKK